MLTLNDCIWYRDNGMEQAGWPRYATKDFSMQSVHPPYNPYRFKKGEVIEYYQWRNVIYPSADFDLDAVTVTIPSLEEQMKAVVEDAPKKDTILVYYSKEFKTWAAESALLNITCSDPKSPQQAVLKLHKWIVETGVKDVG